MMVVYKCMFIYTVYIYPISARADIGKYCIMSGLPQLEIYFWPQCRFELTMFRSDEYDRSFL